jgi:hypothetical protein
MEYEPDHSLLDGTPWDELELMSQYEVPVRLIQEPSPAQTAEEGTA